MIPVVLSTGSVYTYGTARAIELAGRAGFDGVELMMDDRWDTRQATYLQRQIDRFGVPILSVHSPFAGQQLPGWPKPEIERIKLALKLAERVGARTLNFHLPARVRWLQITYAGKRRMVPVPGPDADQKRFAGWLLNGGMADLQARTKVTITVENLPVRRLFGRRYSPYMMNTWDTLAGFPSLCLDTTHTGTTGADLLAVYERLVKNVAHVHLSDYDGRYQHRAVGRGHLPLAGFLQALKAHDYGGVLVVELEPAGLPMQDEDKLAEELRRNREFCRQHLGEGVTSESGTKMVPA